MLADSSRPFSTSNETGHSTESITKLSIINAAILMNHIILHNYTGWAKLNGGQLTFFIVAIAHIYNLIIFGTYKQQKSTTKARFPLTELTARVDG